MVDAHKKATNSNEINAFFDKKISCFARTEGPQVGEVPHDTTRPGYVMKLMQQDNTHKAAAKKFEKVETIRLKYRMEFRNDDRQAK